MRDQFAGDISDLLKFALLRTLAGNDRRLGIGWYFVPGDNGRPDGRHREFCAGTMWKNLDETVWKALVDLPERSVQALEELPFWPSGTIFHRNPILTGKQRESWFEEMKNRLAECDLVFLDPDNGLGLPDKKHATVKEIGQMRKDGRIVVLIKFPAFIPHREQIANYHRQLMKEAGAKSVLTITTSFRIAGKPRIRWFTIIDGEGAVEVRATKFADTLRQIPGCKVHCFNGDPPDNSFGVVDSSIEAGSGPRICPECDRLFKSNTFGGMDAHWKANHEHVMPYSTAWPLIKSGRYVRGREYQMKNDLNDPPLQATPQALGFRMPAEWEQHEATWLAWPHNPEDWPGKFQPIPWIYAEIVRLLSKHEIVHILVDDEKAQQRATSMLDRAGANLAQVAFHIWSTDRSWTRDTGPIFIRNRDGCVGITDWKFNAWAKYPNYKLDDQFPARAAKLLKVPSWQPSIQNENGAKRLVLEGGSIDTNGQGTLLTTEECLLSEVQQRNPGVSREKLEQGFHDYLGIDQVLWLNRGIAGDDTHGHVDDITRFVGPSTIITAVEPATTDPNHEPLAENLARLKAARTLNGKQFTIVELPMPRPVIFSGQRLPASYANFYIANGLVLVPTFHDANDRIALGILAYAFPDREVIGIHCVDLVWGLGTLHCMTQQQPAASSSCAI